MIYPTKTGALETDFLSNFDIQIADIERARKKSQKAERKQAGSLNHYFITKTVTQCNTLGNIITFLIIISQKEKFNLE